MTNVLASVVCWVGQMAGSIISRFSCLARKDSQKKSSRVCAPAGYPALLENAQEKKQKCKFRIQYSVNAAQSVGIPQATNEHPDSQSETGHPDFLPAAITCYLDNIHFNYCDIFSTQYVSWSLHTCLVFRVIKEEFNYPVFLILIYQGRNIE